MKKKFLILSFIFLFAIGRLSAANDKYRLIITSDPATSVTIGWNQTSGTNPIVYYDTVDHGTDYTAYAFSKSVDRSVNYRGMNNMFVRLTGLTPNTAYYFVIHDSEGTSNRFWFKTAPDDSSRLSFIAGGDSRNNRTPRRNANMLVAKLKPHAVFFAGDMTDDDTDSQWQAWFDDWQYSIASDGRMFPIIPAMGNHESREVIYKLFDTPDGTYYYAITFGNNLFRMYTLNTEISVSGTQRTWLINDLNGHANVTWKAAQYHRPMRPHSASKPENDAAYNAWAKVFFDHAVRLVVECDAHVVKSTWPLEPTDASGNDEGFVRNDTYGTVYVGEGGWGAPLRSNDDDKAWTRNSGSFYQFKLIFVDTNKIEVRTIKTQNASSVNEVANNDPFTLPSNLDIWNPSNGSVIEITPAPPLHYPDIEFPSSTPLVYVNGNNIEIGVNVIDQGNGIDHVKFYVNGTLTHTDNSAPYNFTHSYSDGYYIIKAIATASDGLTETEQIAISVGNFNENGNIAVKDGQDDVEETQAGIITYFSSDLEMVYDHYQYISGTPNGYQKVGLRFQEVHIPHGAIITNAYIQFRSDEDDQVNAELVVRAENSADAAPFDDNNTLNVSARTTFQDSVYWTPPPWPSSGLSGPDQRTPDLKNLLQQIINRNDWHPGNSVVFKITGTGVSLTNPQAKRVADSYEGHHPPVLVYSYSFDAANVKTENELLSDVIIYPNPFERTIHINSPSLSGKTVMIGITDLSGRLIYTKEERVQNKYITLSIPIYAKGIYLLTIYKPDGTILYRQRIVKW